MTPFYSTLLLSLAYLFHLATLKTRGKGSWKADQWLLRLQGSLISASLLIWFL